MTERIRRRLEVVHRLGHDQSALDGGLDVHRDARGGRAPDAGGAERCGDVGLHRVGAGENRAGDRGANGGMAVEDLLHHRAEEAGDVGRPADEERDAEVDIAEDSRGWVGEGVVAGIGEDGGGAVAPMIRRGDREGLLVGEVMEEGALADARDPADVLDAARLVAAGADLVGRGVEDELPRAAPRLGPAVAGFGGGARGDH